MQHDFETASNDTGSTGILHIGFSFLLLFISVFYGFPHNEARFYASAAFCLVSSALTFANRVQFKPWSTFVMTSISVVLNTIAIGTILDYPLFVIISTIVTWIQAFTCLPFKFVNSVK